jgi:hypothetical protein
VPFAAAVRRPGRRVPRHGRVDDPKDRRGGLVRGAFLGVTGPKPAHLVQIRGVLGAIERRRTLRDQLRSRLQHERRDLGPLGEGHRRMRGRGRLSLPGTRPWRVVHLPVRAILAA